MKDYFHNLDTVDPLFHALVVERLREIQNSEGMRDASLEDLSEIDELEILRKYSVTLYKEYRALKAVFLENMVVSAKSVKMKYNSN